MTVLPSLFVFLFVFLFLKAIKLLTLGKENILNTSMKKVLLLLIALCFAMVSNAQERLTANLINDGADQTIFDYRVRYSAGLNTHLFYKDGKLMMKLSDPHIKRPVRFARRLRKDGTIEPMPDTMKGPAKYFVERMVLVDDTVAVRVRSMIKALKLRKMKPYYDNKYKKDEIQPTGGSFWNITFIDDKGEYHYSGGRHYVNDNKIQKQLDGYLNKIQTILDYLQHLEVKYCPTPEEKSDGVIQ